MLVLTRKAGESIVIGNEIVVTVLEVRSDQVRIGIAAPRSVQVHREEVFQQMARENAAAVTSADRSNPLLQTRKPAGSRSGRPVPPRRQAPPSNSTGPTGAGAPPRPPAS